MGRVAWAAWQDLHGAAGVSGMAGPGGPGWALPGRPARPGPISQEQESFSLFSSDFSCVSSIQGFSSVAKLLLLVPGQMVENGSFHLRNVTLSAAKKGGPRWWGNAVSLPHRQPPPQTCLKIPEAPLANTVNREPEAVYENIYWVLHSNLHMQMECGRP